MKECEVGRAR